MARGIDFEAASKFRPQEFAREEIEAFLELDPLDYDIYRHRLFQICDEGKQAMEKVACSTITRDCGEVMYGLYTAEGETVLSSTGILLHVASLGIAIRYILKWYKDDPSVGVREGDQFFNNNPFYGGTHNPDQAVLKPVFHEDEIVGWVGCLTHTAPIGAIDPGGMPARAVTKFDEGLRVPIVKIVENDLLKSDIENWFFDSSESPDHLLLDLRAKLAGTHRGNKRLLQLADRYGHEFLHRANRRIIWESAEHCREKVRNVNPGIYRQRHFYDGYGGGERKLWKVGLDLVVGDETLTFDFTNASPKHPGPYNMPPAATLGGVQAGLCPNFFWDVDWNDGIWDVVDIKLPEPGTSLMNADAFCAINHCVLLAEAVGEFTRMATAKLMYDSPYREDLNASWAASSGAPYFGGVNQFGKPFGSMDLNLMGCGTGARVDSDGVDTGGQGWAPDSSCADVESWENESPLMGLIRNHMADSGGYGKFRGGASMEVVWVLRNAPPEGILLGAAGMSDRFHPGHGLFGGYAAPAIQPVLIVNTNFDELVGEGHGSLPFYNADSLMAALEDGRLKGDIMPVSPSFAPIFAKNGDICVFPMSNTGGAGGYGDVLERDPQAVMADIVQQTTSHWTARNVYHVVYDEEALTVDEEATTAARAAVRKERLSLGLPFAEFEQRRARTEPAAEILEAFGPWPNEPAATTVDDLEGLAEVPSEPLESDVTLREITEYLGVDLETELWHCRQCRHALGSARHNYKAFCLIRERAPREVYPPRWGFAADERWCVLREFYCPHCGVLVDVTYTPPGYPVVHDIEPNIDTMKERQRQRQATPLGAAASNAGGMSS